MRVTAIKNKRRVVHQDFQRVYHIERNHDGSALVCSHNDDGSSSFIQLSLQELQLIMAVEPGKQLNVEKLS